jgi:hypothetical protein
MKKRNIVSGIMCLHEILHETKRRKEVGVVLKLDFEKAYDKVNWKLLLTCFEKRGFDKKMVLMDKSGGNWWDSECES